MPATCCRILLLSASLLATGTSLAQLAIDANFDHGALESWSGNLNTVNLTARDNYYGGNRWRWMYFRATGVAGATPSFTIQQNFAGDSTPGPHELAEHEMVYSYDNQNWSYFDNNTLRAIDTDTFVFSNNAPFTHDAVYVAYAIPYSYGDSVAHTQAVLDSPWAMPTASASPSGVIGQSKPGTDDLGRAIPPLDMYAYRITNPATDSPTVAKRKVGLTTGLHAGETLGTHTFEGLVDWLVSDDPRADRLRDVAEFFVYPTLNPSGRYAGMNRTTVTNPGRDPNGLWDASRWNSSSYGCGNNNCQDIRITAQAMATDVFSTPGGGLDAFVDFHSTVPDYANPTGLPHDFGFVAEADSNTDWWLEVMRLAGGNLIEYPSGSGSYTTTGYARRVLGAEIEITIETQFTWDRPVSYYHTLGANFGIAMFNSWLPQVAGDFNGNGIVDLADYTVWRDNLGAAESFISSNGDGSGAVDAGDYWLWKNNFGQSAATLASTTVPEPGGAIILLLLGLGLMLTSRAR